jgi:hypothetical protein
MAPGEAPGAPGGTLGEMRDRGACRRLSFSQRAAALSSVCSPAESWSASVSRSRVPGCGVHSPLQIADGASTQPCSLGERFLRESSQDAVLAQQVPETALVRVCHMLLPPSFEATTSERLARSGMMGNQYTREPAQWQEERRPLLCQRCAKNVHFAWHMPQWCATLAEGSRNVFETGAARRTPAGLDQSASAGVLEERSCLK